MYHDLPHPKSRQLVDTIHGKPITVEDWWDRCVGRSWRRPQTIAELNYIERVIKDELPRDDEVIYGYVDGLGYLLHVSELKEE